MMKIGVTVEDAIQEILEHVTSVTVIEIAVKESFRYIVAEDIYGRVSVPPYNRSLMDGYAIRAADVSTASTETPITLQVKGRVGAGQTTDYELQKGEAIRIMTGAPVPRGADAVAQFEITNAQYSPDIETVKILMPVRKGEAISNEGEDIKAGDRILQKGTVIGAAEMALLATVGVPFVPVYRKPIIGVLSSGRELARLDQPLSFGKIYNSNTYMLAGLISAAGGIPYLLDHVDDVVDEVAAAIQPALPVIDALVTTGGVSVGDYDVMRPAYQLIGGQVHFWKVNMRPGTPFTFASIQDKPVFGLPGNPAAGYINAILFLQTAIRGMSGYSQPQIPPAQVVLAGGIKQKISQMDRFLRANIVLEGGAAKAYPLLTGQGAETLSSLSGIQGLVRIPGNRMVKEGDLVAAYLIDQPKAGSAPD